MPFCLEIWSDGGSDWHPKILLVQLAYLYVMLALDLDLIIVLVTASDLSYLNEVEGVMPVANLALQHQAFEWEQMSDKYESLFKSCNSGKAICDKIVSLPDINDQFDAQKAW